MKQNFFNQVSFVLKSYKRDQIMCQRYLGPPIWYKGDEPEHLTEIFLSNLGHNICENDVYLMCYKFGHIYQIRLVFLMIVKLGDYFF